jgi:uncharacterized membrane protein YhaH (DUF805 family)
MFSSPFSFKGKISRKEFQLSIAYVIVARILVNMFFLTISLTKTRLSENIIFVFIGLIFAILIWFILAQGAKRCHDLGKSAWNQFNPFFILLLVFERGKDVEN